MTGSATDFDGDGDGAEGVYYEIEGVREVLYQAIQAYASEKAGTPIAYDAHAHPYFFIDTNTNGEADEWTEMWYNFRRFLSLVQT